MEFRSTLEMALLAAVGGLAVLFFGYLLVDGVYHRLKWRRLRRKCREAEAVLEEQVSEEEKPGGR